MAVHYSSDGPRGLWAKLWKYLCVFGAMKLSNSIGIEKKAGQARPSFTSMRLRTVRGNQACSPRTDTVMSQSTSVCNAIATG